MASDEDNVLAMRPKTSNADGDVSGVEQAGAKAVAAAVVDLVLHLQGERLQLLVDLSRMVGELSERVHLLEKNARREPLSLRK